MQAEYLSSRAGGSGSHRGLAAVEPGCILVSMTSDGLLALWSSLPHVIETPRARQ